MTGNIACCQNFWFWFLWPYLFFSTPMNLNSIYDLLFSSNSHDDNPSRCPYRPWSNNPSSNHRLFLLSCNMLTSLHGTRFSLTIHHRTAPEGSRNWSDHLSRPPASPERRAMAGRPVLRHNSTGVGAFSERWKKYGLQLKRKRLRLPLQIFSKYWTITQRDIIPKWELLQACHLTIFSLYVVHQWKIEIWLTQITFYAASHSGKLHGLQVFFQLQ